MSRVKKNGDKRRNRRRKEDRDGYSSVNIVMVDKDVVRDGNVCGRV